MAMHPVDSKVKLSERGLDTLGMRFQGVSGKRLLDQDLLVVGNHEETRGSEALTLAIPKSSLLYGEGATFNIHSQYVSSCE